VKNVTCASVSDSASPLSQGERIEVRGFSQGYRTGDETLTLPSPKPTPLPSLALARPSLPAGEKRERRNDCGTDA
jgi:hypothetical protein